MQQNIAYYKQNPNCDTKLYEMVFIFFFLTTNSKLFIYKGERNKQQSAD